MKVHVRREYNAQLILSAVRPWKPTAWRRIAAALDPVFGAPAKTTLRTNQKLGRLSWDHWQKWTRAKNFDYLDAWSPPLSVFERTGQPPDAFLHIINPQFGAEKPVEGVVSYVLLAIAVEVERRETPAFLAALDPVKRFTRRCAWGRDLGGGAFEPLLQYFLLTLERNKKTGRLHVPAAWKAARVSVPR